LDISEANHRTKNILYLLADRNWLQDRDDYWDEEQIMAEDETAKIEIELRAMGFKGKDVYDTMLDFYELTKEAKTIARAKRAKKGRGKENFDEETSEPDFRLGFDDEPVTTSEPTQVVLDSHIEPSKTILEEVAITELKERLRQLEESLSKALATQEASPPRKKRRNRSKRGKKSSEDTAPKSN
jgi:hypothetical protein